MLLSGHCDEEMYSPGEFHTCAFRSEAGSKLLPLVAEDIAPGGHKQSARQRLARVLRL